MEPKVSVIVPVYNVLPFLREALDSVVSQSYRNLEILIVDDGSTDGSGAVCDEYLRDGRVRVLHQENRGLSAARNSALERMTGDYVAFLDSDDAYRPDMIRQMVAAAQRDGAEIVVCGYEKIWTEGALEGARAPEVHRHPDALLPHDEAMRRLIDGKLFSYVCNKLFARRLWDGVRFPEGQVFEDLHVFCTLLDRCACCRLLSGCMYLYRSRPGSIVRTHTLKHYLDYMHAMRVFETYVSESSVGERFARSIRLLADRNQLALELEHMKWTPEIPAEDRAEWDKLREELIRRRRTDCPPARPVSVAAFWVFLHCPKLIPPLAAACVSFLQRTGRA